MKRKSILMTIVAVLFAGVAMAQTTWPPAVGSLPNYKGADTIFFCNDPNVKYPIELGYDVPGLYLHPSYGDWSLYAISDKASADDYKFTADKNGGAGNAFKVIGSGLGGYIFKYTAKDAQCGLNAGESYYVYVFIMPTLNNAIAGDTTLCVTPGGTFTQNAALIFEHAELYQKAGFTVNWTPNPPTITQDLSVTGSFRHTFNFSLTDTHPDYTCKTVGKYNFDIFVVDSLNLAAQPLVGTLCVDDTISEPGKGNRLITDFLGRTQVAGTYTIEGTSTTVSQIKDLNSYWTSSIKKANLVFTYTDPCTSTPNKTVVDTLYFEPDFPNGFAGTTTASICRTGTENDLNNIYRTHGGILSLIPGSVTWADWGTTGTSPINYGTIGNVTSLVSESEINTGIMISNTNYHYNVTLLAPYCVEGDSARLIVVINDPIIAADLRTQMCADHSTADLDLNAYISATSSTATWKDAGGNVIPNGILPQATIAAITTGTVAKLSYALGGGADACSSGEAVFYIKKTQTPVISTANIVTYCQTKRPPIVNLNDVLGFISPGNTWAMTSAQIKGGAAITNPAVAAALNSATGLYNLTDGLSAAGVNLNNDTVEITFTMTNPGSCAPANATVTLVITPTLTF